MMEKLESNKKIYKILHIHISFESAEMAQSLAFMTCEG